MKKLNPILEQILFTRFLWNITEQLGGAVAAEVAPAARGAFRGALKNIKPTGVYELPPVKPSSLFPKLPKTIEIPSSVDPSDYFKQIIDSEIESAISKTTNPEEIFLQITTQQTGDLLSSSEGSSLVGYISNRIKERTGVVSTPSELEAMPELQPIRIPEVPTPYSPPPLPETEPVEVGSQTLSYTGVPSTETYSVTSTSPETSLVSALSPMTQPQYAMMISSLLKTGTKTGKPRKEKDDDDEDFDVSEKDIDLGIKSSELELPGSSEKADVDLRQTKLGKYSGSYRLK